MESNPADGSLQWTDLEGDARERAVPVLIDSFVGIYRWHAKRTLYRVSRVRAALLGGTVVGVAMLERLAPEIGYVYYLAVARNYRRRGLGGALLDDALAAFRSARARIVYAAAEEENEESISLFRSRGFRVVERDEPSYQDGGLGAHGLRTKMMLVPGEVLLGIELGSAPTTAADASANRSLS